MNSWLLEEEKQTAISKYENLNVLIKAFLGVSLERARGGEAALFGYRIAETGLSEGQTILLQFCVAIEACGGNLSNLIVILDEPESHLHPSVAIEMIRLIQKGLHGGQLWVATHSIPLLAQFDPSCIWWMEDGEVSYAGSITRTVLKGLLGDEDELLRLSDFLNLPFEMASIRFAHQCLFPPHVVETGKDDPQTIQILDIIQSATQAKKSGSLTSERAKDA